MVYLDDKHVDLQKYALTNPEGNNPIKLRSVKSRKKSEPQSMEDSKNMEQRSGFEGMINESFEVEELLDINTDQGSWIMTREDHHGRLRWLHKQLWEDYGGKVMDYRCLQLEIAQE